MNKAILFGVLGVALLGGAIYASETFASVGNRGFGINYSPERHAQMVESRQGRGPIDGQRGQNRGGNFIDKNGDGICDHMQ